MTISADTLNKSFDTSAIDTLDFNKIRRDLFQCLIRKIISSWMRERRLRKELHIGSHGVEY